MKRLLGIALGAGLLTASCSGNAGHLLPGGAGARPAGATRAAQDVIVAPPGWAATATRGATVVDGADTGALNPSTPLTVRLGLNLHNEDGLKSLIAARQRISPQQFAAQFGPTQTEIASVVSYLQSQGFGNIKAEGQLVSADGTAAQAAKAFDTTLESFSLGGASVYANTKPAFVPSALGGVVSAVLGLNDAAKVSLHPRASTHTVSCLGTAAPTGQCAPSFNAKDVQSYYDAGTVTPAVSTTVAVMAEGNVSQVVSDLRYAEAKQGLPAVPTRIITVGLPSSDTAGVVEWDLDTQSSTGMAQSVSALNIYATTSLTDSDIANEYNAWVMQDAAQLGNSSFGECEYSPFLDGAMRVDDHLFMQAAAQGQTMFVSTGDTGSACALAPTNGVPASGIPMVEYPAASPYAIGVGGTSAIANAADSSYVGEVAWNAGGGGLSQFENTTTWQQTAQLTNTGLAATNLRGLPDIAMAADSVAGAYNIYGPNIPGVGDCSAGCAVGGTSEASPLAMGAYARLLSAHGALGFAGPPLYQNFVDHQSGATTVTGPPPTQALGGFHDVITGGNGLYTALPGYDYTTGLGTLDISVMNAQLGSL